MTNVTATTFDRAAIAEFDIIEREVGALIDADGYSHPTHSGEALIANELDEDGHETGRRIAYFGNNADGEGFVTEAATIAEAAAQVDRDWLMGLYAVGEMSFLDEDAHRDWVEANA